MGTLNLSFGNTRAQVLLFDKDTTVDIGNGMPVFPCLAHTPYAFPRVDSVILGTSDVTVAIMVHPTGSSGQAIQCFAIEYVILVP